MLQALALLSSDAHMQAQTDSTATRPPAADMASEPAAPPKLTLKGYIKLLNTEALPPNNGDWRYDNLVHNRINLRWYASEHLTITVDGRTRFFFGQSLQDRPGYADQVTAAPGYTTLGGRLVELRSFLLHAVADCAYVDWTRANGKSRRASSG